MRSRNDTRVIKTTLTASTSASSCSTLIDVHQETKKEPLVEVIEETNILVPICASDKTNLHLPRDTSCTSSDESDHYSHPLQHQLQQRSTSEYLAKNPLFLHRAKKALARHTDQFRINPKRSHNAPPVIYVHQREVAHVSSRQYNRRGAILTTDSATTCHVIALRSSNNLNKERLGSLCHLDSTKYTSDLEAMFAEHVKYHKGADINLDVHVVGGYNDEKGTSAGTTDHIFEVLKKMSTLYESNMEVTLQTCVVSELNDVTTYTQGRNDWGHQEPSPVARGMALDVASGHIQLLNVVDDTLCGPEQTLRRVRLWSDSIECKSLLTVHTYEKEELVIKPFSFKPFADIELFVALPDDLMLEYGSTSPECEADNFCKLVRESCRFIMNTSVESVFGPTRSDKIVYRRTTNQWEKSV